MNERKYRKQVNKNGWMITIQRACYGKSTPQFVGYCPFFWFTWLSLILLPVLFPLRMVLKLFGLLFGMIATSLEERPFRPNNASLAAFYENYLGSLQMGKTQDEALEWEKENNWAIWGNVLKWIAKTPDWENCAKRALLLKQQAEARKAEAQTRNEYRKKRLAKLAQYAGYVVKVVLAFVSLIALYFLGRCLFYIFSRVTLHEIWTAAKWTGIAIGSALLIVVLADGALKSFRWFRRCPKRPNRLAFLLRWLIWIMDTIYGAGSFITETIEMIYTRECPLIEWGDESGPIERN